MLSSTNLRIATQFQESKPEGIKYKALNINCFEIQNRRFLGNKYKLLNFIKNVVLEKAPELKSFCDIFAGTGIVGQCFNNEKTKIISNDLLLSNYVCISSFLETKTFNSLRIIDKISYLNNISAQEENYFSKNYGGTFFTIANALKIGQIREEIDIISENEDERKILLTSLLYAVDKVANTVGHYDAFINTLNENKNLQLLIPRIQYAQNKENQVFNKDANEIIKQIETDVIYIDPPYNSRQYSGAYHLLENLISWQKPMLEGKARKMDRTKLKSKYCLKEAPEVFADLIQNANCKHIFISYNDTGENLNSRSNARIKDENIMDILNQKGKVEIFETDYRVFQTGKSKLSNNKERIFYCKVK
jgi:adenine-specific DNA-methyltransferase